MALLLPRAPATVSQRLQFGVARMDSLHQLQLELNETWGVGRTLAEERRDAAARQHRKLYRELRKEERDKERARAKQLEQEELKKAPLVAAAGEETSDNDAYDDDDESDVPLLAAAGEETSDDDGKKKDKSASEEEEEVEEFIDSMPLESVLRVNGGDLSMPESLVPAVYLKMNPQLQRHFSVHIVNMDAFERTVAYVLRTCQRYQWAEVEKLPSMYTQVS
jgi:hypothetical protein